MRYILLFLEFKFPRLETFVTIYNYFININTYTILFYIFWRIDLFYQFFLIFKKAIYFIFIIIIKCIISDNAQHIINIKIIYDIVI